MSERRLHRSAPAPPVRAVHLGLGNFFRAHQAWYTDRADDEPWGIAAYSGRRADLARALRAQDGLYTLVTRAADGDGFGVVRSISRAHAASEHQQWLADFACPDVRLLTVTITEAGYRRGRCGGLDTADPELVSDLAALRTDQRSPVRTAPARILAGLLARRHADAGPLTLVPCDNLPDNGRVLAAVLRDLAEALDPALSSALEPYTSVVTTVVDRITPEPTDDEAASVLAGTGVDDRCPVATEPFSEWVVSGSFPGGRPAWERAGAVLTGDITPFEERKLWLLNGGHSLLAYAASLRGYTTVADAVADPICRGWLQDWWDTCARYIRLPEHNVSAYCAALQARFANPRIRHNLTQIAADGSQKLPVRVIPVLARERAAGRLPAAAVTVLAAWVLHLRGGPTVKDVQSPELLELAEGRLATAVPRVLARLSVELAEDDALVSAVRRRAEDLCR